MLESDNFKRQKEIYRNCYNKTVNTANALSNSINTLCKLVSVQGSAYVVNDIKGGNNDLNHVLEEEKNIYNNIVNNILPDLRNKINDLNNRINLALQQEAMEDD